jgi:hypothetical protein
MSDGFAIALRRPVLRALLNRLASGLYAEIQPGYEDNVGVCTRLANDSLGFTVGADGKD